MKRTHLFLKKKFDSKGAVLIEFAFCCPVLIILLFFVLDIPSAYRVVTKMQKMSELTANMIRNVPNKSNTLISLEDLKNISKVAGVTLTGKLGSSSKPCKNYPFYLSTYVFCIVGNSGGGYDKKWNVHIKNKLYDGTISVNTNDTTTYSKFQTAINFNTIEGLENFNIQEGEVKLIIETVAWYDESENASIEGVSSGSGNNSGSDMFGGYKKNKFSVRGYNKSFYLMTIPGRSISSGVKAFGNRYSIMSCVDEIVDVDECPK